MLLTSTKIFASLRSVTDSIEICCKLFIVQVFLPYFTKLLNVHKMKRKVPYFSLEILVFHVYFVFLYFLVFVSF